MNEWPFTKYKKKKWSMWHTGLEKIYKNGTLFKQNKPHQNETAVCYCTVYIQKLWSRGRLVSRSFRNTKLHLQACLCVNVNKLDLNNTSWCVLPLLGLCLTNIKHDAQHTENQLSWSDVSLWRPECKFSDHFKWSFFFCQHCEHVFMLYCSEIWILKIAPVTCFHQSSS